MTAFKACDLHFTPQSDHYWQTNLQVMISALNFTFYDRESCTSPYQITFDAYIDFLRAML